MNTARWKTKFRGKLIYAPMVLDTTLRRTELGDVLDAFYLGLSSHAFPPTPFGPAFEWEKALCEEKR